MSQFNYKQIVLQIECLPLKVCWIINYAKKKRKKMEEVMFVTVLIRKFKC